LQKYIFGLCLSFVNNNNDEAWDLYQESIIKIIKSLPGLKQTESFISFLYTIVKNTFYDLCSKKQRRKEAYKIYAELRRGRQIPGADAAMLAAEILMIVELLASERELEVFLLHFLGLSCQEVSEELGISVYTVHVHLHNLRKKLKKYLDEFEADREYPLGI
jgi:RNA polymerase sigma-70 factor (ECF subfamily)